MTETLFAISTYRKNEALKGIIDSLIKNGYLEQDFHILITDDDNGTAKEIYEGYFAQYPTKFSYVAGERQGIAVNKNRGIYFFLEKTDAKYLILSDDDILITAPGLNKDFIKASIDDRLGHITSYLGVYEDVPEKRNLFEKFATISETEHVYHLIGGCHGICSFYTREVIEQIMYFRKFKFFYGYEHSEHSMRANKVQGRCQEMFPVFKDSPKYIRCQGIPNDYNITAEDLEKNIHGLNGNQYKEYKLLTYKGYDLKVTDHTLDLTRELIL